MHEHISGAFRRNLAPVLFVPMSFGLGLEGLWNIAMPSPVLRILQKMYFIVLGRLPLVCGVRSSVYLLESLEKVSVSVVIPYLLQIRGETVCLLLLAFGVAFVIDLGKQPALGLV